MAAVHPQSSRQRPHPSSRLRSSSDPFSDPSPTSTSRRRRPPPPPKSNTSSKMPAAVSLSAPPTPKDINDITEAVRETVTLHDRSDNTRVRAPRSQTMGIPTTTNPTARPMRGRSHSEETESPRSAGKSRGKKSSQHADVIDRLDYTATGGLFHHDGPFDACAPSRNKHRNRAPLHAWTEDPTYGNNSAYAAAHAYSVFSNDYPEPPKKKVDAIAEAWGMHEPEPFEEFFAGGGSNRPEGDTPGSSIYNGRDSHKSNSPSRHGLSKRGIEETQSSQQQNPTRPRVATRRSLVPPPQPIFVPDPVEPVDTSVSVGSGGGNPKRQKSLMHRIRKMRDAPNVPMGPEYEQPPSPSSPNEVSYSGDRSRPTHKSQNSFLGRFGGSKSGPQSPANPHPEPFLLVEPIIDKDLPVLPPNQTVDAPGSPGVNRKTSIMKKVGRVVRGTK